MPSLADITVKKNDGTTDITYSGVQPSSGDGSPAIWKSATVGYAAAHQPEFRLSSKDGARGSRRVVRATFKYPQLSYDTTTSLFSLVDTSTFMGEWVMPKTMNQADIDEFASQIANLIHAALTKSCVKTGYAAG